MEKLLTTFLLSFVLFNLFAQNELVRINSKYNGYRTTTKKILDADSYNRFFKNKSIVWSEGTNISLNENEDSRDMDIAMGPDSTLHIVYCNDRPDLPSISMQKITYKSKTPNGEWSAGIIIDEFSGVEPRNNHEASICVSNNGDVHVVFHYWAYDGTFRDQIGYSKLEAASGLWTTELISGSGGTVESTYSDYPRVASTTSNYPVVVWGTDNRSGRENVYLAYNDGIWHDPILISAPLGGKSQWPDIVPIGDDKVFIIYREYNNNHTLFAYYYRIFDATDGSLSGIVKIEDSERLSNSNYDYYDQARACHVNNTVFIADNSKDTIQSYYYDIADENLSRNPENYISNINSYPNYNILSVVADNNNYIHIAFTVWNTSSNSLQYLTYNDEFGYSDPIVISENDNIDAPSIIFGFDHQLHVAFCDDSEDTNNDGYVDREVYYTYADITTNINDKVKSVNEIKAFPNPSKNGVFRLNTQESFPIKIFNTSGQLVLETFSKNIIDLSNQPNGTYILKGENKNDSFSIMLIRLSL